MRLFKLPYCNLYDLGYTSLGKKSDTQPNPALQRKTLAFLETPANSSIIAHPSLTHWPAYMLADWTLERAGRVKKPSLASTVTTSSTDCTVDKRNNPESSPSTPTTPMTPVNTPIVPPCDEKRKIESAALIIIGDEILNGLTADVNLQATSKALQAIDIPLKMVSIVSDEIQEIANEVIRLSQKYDIVITSGGIGPTHDDVTIKAIAKALKQDMKMNIPMLQHLEEIQLESINSETSNNDQEEGLKVISVAEHDVDEYWEKAKQADPNIDIPNLRRQTFTIDETMESFALLPKESVLHFPPPPDDYYYTPRKKSDNNQTVPENKQVSAAATTIKHKTWPILQCDNIYILPGVPQYFAKKIQLLTKYFLKSKVISPSISPTTTIASTESEGYSLKEIRKIVLNVEEKNLIHILNTLVSKYTPSTSSGSSSYSQQLNQLQYVKFGSYPFVDHPEYKTIITIESYNPNLLDDAMSELIQLLPLRSVLRVEKIDLQQTN